jgi:hypothetical protein
MSLPVGERRKLRRIERAAVRADPGLAARFSIFNRLSRYEDMPRTERLKMLGIGRKRWPSRSISAYLISGTDTLLPLLRTGSGSAAAAGQGARSRGAAAVLAM